MLRRPTCSHYIQRLSAVYFAEVLSFCLMGNHFHLLVRMQPAEAFSNDEIWTRFQRYYGADSNRQWTDGQIPTLRAKWANLSDYVKEIKQGFSRWYNKRHGPSIICLSLFFPCSAT